MRTGTVRYWKNSFGFITPDDAKTRDVFVHFSVIEGEGYRELAVGEKVEFTAEKVEKGIQATLVRKLGD